MMVMILLSSLQNSACFLVVYLFVCFLPLLFVSVISLTMNPAASVKDRRNWHRRGISGNSAKKRNKNEKMLRGCPPFQRGMFSISELNAMYSILVTCFFWLNLLCHTGNTPHYYNNVLQNYFSAQKQTSTKEKKKHKRMNKQTKKQAKKETIKVQTNKLLTFPF